MNSMCTGSCVCEGSCGGQGCGMTGHGGTQDRHLGCCAVWHCAVQACGQQLLFAKQKKLNFLCN